MSAYAAAPDAYRQSSVLTASPGQLVVMLHDGAHRFLVQTAGAMREGLPGVAGERRGDHRGPARQARHEAGGEVTERLEALYVFFKDHLGQARRDQDADNVDDVGRMMRELRSSWAEIAGS